ncbi:MAG: (2Fe-2S)-binding protein [Candidatus Riflebacteria bacterium]|nr:(2Fe-2S)-binding protein [Candidatus Riflebacteria bacterium]
MAEKITLTVNQVPYTIEIEGWEHLIDVLRDEIGLTGTKRGCDDLSCGACTVLMNGEAVKSCQVLAKRASGADVVTIEALAQGTKLHPIQEALIESGAVQCGFCIPGIVMGLHGLFRKKLDATEAEIADTLENHLCRCTGYEAIFEGAKLAQKKLKAR